MSASKSPAPMPPDGKRRRRALSLLAFGLASSIAAGVAWRLRTRIAWYLPLAGGVEATLVRIVDLIVPADESPGALDLGVHRMLLERASTDREFRQLVRWGCQWFDEAAAGISGKAFAESTETVQAAVMQRASEAPRGSVPERFFRQVRDSSFTLHYSQPRSWAAIGFQGPPQPSGYPGYAAAPARGMRS